MVRVGPMPVALDARTGIHAAETSQNVDSSVQHVTENTTSVPAQYPPVLVQSAPSTVREQRDNLPVPSSDNITLTPPNITNSDQRSAETIDPTEEPPPVYRESTAFRFFHRRNSIPPTPPPPYVPTNDHEQVDSQVDVSAEQYDVYYTMVIIVVLGFPVWAIMFLIVFPFVAIIRRLFEVCKSHEASSVSLS